MKLLSVVNLPWEKVKWEEIHPVQVLLCSFPLPTASPAVLHGVGNELSEMPIFSVVSLLSL